MMDAFTCCNRMLGFSVFSTYWHLVLTPNTLRYSTPEMSMLMSAGGKGTELVSSSWFERDTMQLLLITQQYSLLYLAVPFNIFVFLSASAGFHWHVWIHLQHHVFVFVKEEHTQSIHFVGYTAGLRNSRDNPNSLDNALDCCMIGGSNHLWQNGQ